MRWITMVTLLLLLGVSYGLYQLKYRVEGLQHRAEQLNSQIADDRRAIKVLGAEWAYLTRPQRLQRLSGEFLPLIPVHADQIAAMDELPLKPVIGLEPAGPVIDDLSLNPVTGEIDGGPAAPASPRRERGLSMGEEEADGAGSGWYTYM